MSTIVSVESGWWYSAVTPQDKRIISFHTDADLVPKKEFNTKTYFYEQAQRVAPIKTLISSENNLNFQGVVGANSTRLEEFCGDGWVAIGDAAISFDPLSSQGMFNALVNAVQLRDNLLKNNHIITLNKSVRLNFISEYNSSISKVWAAYLAHKNLYYSVEKRWPNHAFWRRRG